MRYMEEIMGYIMNAIDNTVNFIKADHKRNKKFNKKKCKRIRNMKKKSRRINYKH